MGGGESGKALDLEQTDLGSPDQLCDLVQITEPPKPVSSFVKKTTRIGPEDKRGRSWPRALEHQRCSVNAGWVWVWVWSGGFRN